MKKILKSNIKRTIPKKFTTDLDSAMKRIASKKQYEIFNPELMKSLESNFDINYFPRGSDPFMDGLVETFKKYVNTKITNT